MVLGSPTRYNARSLTRYNAIQRTRTHARDAHARARVSLVRAYRSACARRPAYAASASGAAGIGRRGMSGSCVMSSGGRSGVALSIEPSMVEPSMGATCGACSSGSTHASSSRVRSRARGTRRARAPTSGSAARRHAAPASKPRGRSHERAGARGGEEARARARTHRQPGVRVRRRGARRAHRMRHVDSSRPPWFDAARAGRLGFSCARTLGRSIASAVSGEARGSRSGRGAKAIGAYRASARSSAHARDHRGRDAAHAT